MIIQANYISVWNLCYQSICNVFQFTWYISQGRFGRHKIHFREVLPVEVPDTKSELHLISFYMYWITLVWGTRNSHAVCLKYAVGDLYNHLLYIIDITHSVHSFCSIWHSLFWYFMILCATGWKCKKEQPPDIFKVNKRQDMNVFDSSITEKEEKKRKTCQFCRN